VPFAPTGGGVNITAPTDANVVPPGYYLMYLLNGAGVPSEARIVLVTAAGVDRTPPLPHPLPAPRVVAAQVLRGSPRHPARRLRITFSEPMLSGPAREVGNYRVEVREPNRHGRLRNVKILSASYDTATHSVVLSLGKWRPGTRRVRLTVNSPGTGDLADWSGVPLDGDGDGTPGGPAVIWLRLRAGLKR
jgi:hypothetical protein